MAQDSEEQDQPEADPVARVAAGLKAKLPQFLLLSRGPRPAPGQPKVYRPPTYTLRSEAREAIHDRALQDIARLRFGFPTPKYPYYKTYVNHPQRAMGVQMSDGLVAYPDIVVVQHPENYSKIVAELETNETVREDVAQFEWRPFADLAPLYLYVPVGKGDEALALCRRLGVPVVGIRTWRYVVGYEEIEVNDHYTVPSGPEDLLPKLLRRR
ncbi:MAG: hypothetical protein HYY03_05220 [Chloroflexi bacterium]|nr:hypothetical protein [Chloroflexota bacterium]